MLLLACVSEPATITHKPTLWQESQQKQGKRRYQWRYKLHHLRLQWRRCLAHCKLRLAHSLLQSCIPFSLAGHQASPSVVDVFMSHQHVKESQDFVFHPTYSHICCLSSSLCTVLSKSTRSYCTCHTASFCYLSSERLQSDDRTQELFQSLCKSCLPLVMQLLPIASGVAQR